MIYGSSRNRSISRIKQEFGDAQPAFDERAPGRPDAARLSICGRSQSLTSLPRVDDRFWHVVVATQVLEVGCRQIRS
jgi:hypothetical protein